MELAHFKDVYNSWSYRLANSRVQCWNDGPQTSTIKVADHLSIVQETIIHGPTQEHVTASKNHLQCNKQIKSLNSCLSLL